MNKSITLPIFFNTQDTSNLNLAGIDFPLSDCQTRNMIFYRIDAIVDYFDEHDNYKQYTEIHTSGHSFLSALKKSVIDEMINEAFR